MKTIEDVKHDSFLCWLVDGDHDSSFLLAHADGRIERCSCRCHEKGE